MWLEALMKWVQVQFYKSRLKHHYLETHRISGGYNCGRTLRDYVNPRIAAHEKKVEEYRLKLRNLGEPI